MESTNIRTGETSASPDSSWSELYRAGGVCALLYVVLGMLVPEWLFRTSAFDTSMSGAATLDYIASHKAWWIAVQVLSLGLSVVAIVVFVALFVALKHVNKSYAAIGTVIALSSQVLILSYWPITMGQFALANRYVAATTQTTRQALATAAEGLVAQNSIPAHSIEISCALGVTVLSLVMLKSVFSRKVAALGIATFPVAVLGEGLAPALGMNDLVYLWWAFFLVWLAAVGWTLIRLPASIERFDPIRELTSSALRFWDVPWCRNWCRIMQGSSDISPPRSGQITRSVAEVTEWCRNSETLLRP